MKIEIPTGAAYILQQLNKHGYEAYIVGGCVRDSLLGKQPNDWDITTSAKPEEVKAIFHRTIDTGIQHGTVTVLVDREILDDGRGLPASHTDYAFEVTTRPICLRAVRLYAAVQFSFVRANRLDRISYRVCPF